MLKKDFEKSFDNKEKTIDKSIKLIRDQVDRVPFFNERKMEVMADRLLIQNAKEEEVDKYTVSSCQFKKMTNKTL